MEEKLVERLVSFLRVPGFFQGHGDEGPGHFAGHDPGLALGQEFDGVRAQLGGQHAVADDVAATLDVAEDRATWYLHLLDASRALAIS